MTKGIDFKERMLNGIGCFGLFISITLFIYSLLSAALPSNPIATQVSKFGDADNAKAFIISQSRNGWKVKTVTAMPETFAGNSSSHYYGGSRETWLVVLEK